MEHITISISEYKKLLADSQDAMHLKTFLAERYKSYISVDHKELETICKLFGLVGEEE